MSTSNTRLIRAVILACTIILLVSSACNLPGVGRPTPAPTQESTADQSTPSQETPQNTSSATSSIPENILTEAAATIHANVTAQAATQQAVQTAQAATQQAEQTAQASALPSEPPQAPAPPQPLAPTATPTNTPTQTSTFTPTPTSTATHTVKPHTFTPTATNTPTQPALTKTLGAFTPLPTSSDSTWITDGFRVRNVHLQACGNGYAANFSIRNTARVSLQSLSLQFIDRSTNTVLLGPESTNLPFMNTDRTCIFSGIDALAPGQTLYLGNWLGPMNLQTHTIRAVIKLCTRENLAGACYVAPVEFVVP